MVRRWRSPSRRPEPARVSPAPVAPRHRVEGDCRGTTAHRPRPRPRRGQDLPLPAAGAGRPRRAALRGPRHRVARHRARLRAAVGQRLLLHAGAGGLRRRPGHHGRLPSSPSRAAPSPRTCCSTSPGCSPRGSRSSPRRARTGAARCRSTPATSGRTSRTTCRPCSSPVSSWRRSSWSWPGSTRRGAAGALGAHRLRGHGAGARRGSGVVLRRPRHVPRARPRRGRGPDVPRARGGGLAQRPPRAGDGPRGGGARRAVALRAGLPRHRHRDARGPGGHGRDLAGHPARPRSCSGSRSSSSPSFAAFWVVQTVELWRRGLRRPEPVPEEEVRA